MREWEHLSQLVQAERTRRRKEIGRSLCYINYTIESFKIADNLVILPIANCCRPMLQYSHDENNKRTGQRPERKEHESKEIYIRRKKKCVNRKSLQLRFEHSERDGSSGMDVDRNILQFLDFSQGQVIKQPKGCHAKLLLLATSGNV